MAPRGRGARGQACVRRIGDRIIGHLPDDTHETKVGVTLPPELLGALRSAGAQQACLVQLSGDRIGHRTVLGESPLVIGRGSACELRLDVDSVSRQHARVEHRDGEHWLEDNRSTNGTYVNHVRVERTALRDGDRIGIGKCMLKYLASGNLEAAYHDELQRLVNHDGLTGAKNKRWFDEELPSAADRATAAGERFSLVVFDLDHFKRVNDTHGHPAGDAVLRRVAEVVQLALPHDTALARVGGEEFAVLLAGHALRSAYDVAQALRERVESTRIVFERIHIPITLSLGVAERAEGEREAEFYARADAKLYEAKHAGRNRVRY